MNLNITKERILEAAAKCSTAKQTLQVLFPEAFEVPKPVYPLKVGDVYKHPQGIICHMLLIQAHYGQDKYILLGDAFGLTYSNTPHEKTMTLVEVEQYLTKDGMVYHRNVHDGILNLITRD